MVEKRVQFLKTCANRHLELSVEFGSNAPFAEQIMPLVRSQRERVMTDGIAARFLVQAAEIMMASGELEGGFRILVEALQRLLPNLETIPTEQPFFGSIQDFTRAALLCALTNSGSLQLTANGGVLLYGGRSFEFEWSRAQDPKRFASLLPVLLSGEIAGSGLNSKVRELLLGANEDRILSLVIRASSLRTDFEVLGLHPSVYSDDRIRSTFQRLNRRNGYAAYRQLESAYSRMIAFSQRDAYHWNSLRYRAAIVDWRLLLIQVWLIKSGARKPRIISQEVLEPEAFSWSLASWLSDQHRQS
jgi:hypothetical protein